MIGTLIQAELEELIREKKLGELRDVLVELDVSDIADIIMDLPPEDQGVIFRVLPRCPMCGCETWEQAPWSPFARAGAPLR